MDKAVGGFREELFYFFGTILFFGATIEFLQANDIRALASYEIEDVLIGSRVRKPLINIKKPHIIGEYF